MGDGLQKQGAVSGEQACAILSRDEQAATDLLSRLLALAASLSTGNRFFRYEPNVGAAIESNLGPGSTVFDIGANVGCFTLFASKIVGPLGH
jgi:hypothetical protein